MKISPTQLSGTVAAFFVFVLLSPNAPLRAQFASLVPPGSALTIPEAQVLSPEAMSHLLQTSGADKPLILQVGSHLLYAEGHIPDRNTWGQVHSQPDSSSCRTG